jgi:signal transduction histidine kinase/ActR/RegA family two-component response regulator
MNKKLGFLQTVLFLLYILTSGIASAQPKVEKILFLSSYNLDWTSVPDEIKGFTESVDPLLEINYLFMNTRHVTYEQAEQTLLYTIRQTPESYASYKCIVAADDNALDFALTYKKKLFGNAPIVFMAVNNEDKAKKASLLPDVSGIIEKNYYAETIAVARKLYPGATELLAITDMTNTAAGNRMQLEKELADSPFRLSYLNTSELSAAEIKNRLSVLDTHTILLFLNFLYDKDGNQYTLEQSARFVFRHSSIPAFRTKIDGGLKNGLLGGEMISSENMGEQAAQLVGQILNGKNLTQVNSYTSPGMLIFNQEVLDKYKIRIPHNILQKAEIINRHQKFLEPYYRQLLIGSVSVILMLFLLLVYKLHTANISLKNSERKALKAKAEAEKANAVKTDFLARMSHDMRTPLGAVIGLSDFGIEEKRNQTDVVYFQQIKDSSVYLLSLLNDILDMQKIEKGHIELTPKIAKPGRTCGKIEPIIRSRAEKKHITLIVERHCTRACGYIKVDEERVQQILINILNNAVKYTPEGGTVTWKNEFSYDEKGRMMVTHIISDNGVGMSKEYQKHMFEPFSREHNALSQSEGSTGLGLAIVYNLVLNMGGTISCESELGKGTTITVTIPHEIPTEAEIAEYSKTLQEKIETKNLQGLHVLLCEDNEINTEIAVKMLQTQNINVDTAKNGIEGIEKASENHYDIILMDIRMPLMNGLDATREIRKFNKTTPIIALSANAYQEDIKQSIEAGMNIHLSKPIDRENLFTAIEKLLQKKL